MKRTVSFILIFLLALPLAACTVSPAAMIEPTEAPTEAPATEAPATDEPALTEVPVVTDEPAPTDEPVSTPVPEWPADADLPRIIQNGGTAFLICPDGTVYGWGNNEYGQLGIEKMESISCVIWRTNNSISFMYTNYQWSCMVH